MPVSSSASSQISSASARRLQSEITQVVEPLLSLQAYLIQALAHSKELRGKARLEVKDRYADFKKRLTNKDHQKIVIQWLGDPAVIASMEILRSEVEKVFKI